MVWDGADMVIPDSPLPGVRHCRIAVVGDDPLARELGAGLGLATGRPVTVDPGPPRAADLVFVAAADAGVVTDLLREAWPPGAVGVVRATLPGVTQRAAGLSSFLQLAQRIAPHLRLVGALHLISADHLALAAVGALRTDVPVVADDEEAADLVTAVIDGVPGLTGIRVGAARTAAGIERLAGVVRAVESDRGHPVGVRLDRAALRFVDPDGPCR